MGLQNQVVGVTKFCVHPFDIKKNSKVIGGTKNPNINKILALKPDLIIANKEENRQEDIDLLNKDLPVYTSDIKNSEDNLRFLQDLQTIFPHKDVFKLINSLTSILPYQNDVSLQSCYLIWKDPWMTVGNDTFIHHMMSKYGFKNVFDNQPRYPIFKIDEIKAKNPEVILLSSEPFPFKAMHIAQMKELLPHIPIILVDGELFSWYGPRMLKAHEYLMELKSSLSLVK